jgi:uncharacterized membrane protein YphA (DoxX/SURF4 family)
MTTLDKIQTWGDHHHPKWLDVFRIVLGCVLIWKAIAFLLNLNVLADFLYETGLTDQIGASVLLNLLTYAIIGLHLVGGIYIAIGVNTRLYCLLNLPVVLGAVVLVDFRNNILKPYSEIWLSVFVLIFIICFLIVGDGRRLSLREES